MSGMLLLDECMSPRIVTDLWQLGVDTVHVRDRGLLGAPDYVLWNYAQVEQRTVCTINAADFAKLARSTRDHSGLVIIPSGGPASDQLSWVGAAVSWVSTSNSVGGFLNHYIEVGEDGQIVLAELACA